MISRQSAGGLNRPHSACSFGWSPGYALVYDADLCMTLMMTGACCFWYRFNASSTSQRSRVLPSRYGLKNPQDSEFGNSQHHVEWLGLKRSHKALPARLQQGPWCRRSTEPTTTFTGVLSVRQIRAQQVRSGSAQPWLWMCSGGQASIDAPLSD